ncbi:50S ribosomal protein L3 [Metamycoplasma salivarium]|uniref:Large ribosomal subunit protein uL3 n=2 Tax=Metamycoplasma salivarium TaxID=2124 RepID=A0A448ZXS0_METSV|nr:50S ribosomal protein L3 [Metamycoplasma salivarium]GIZ06299.1 50S ribosomal protein L3 [Metamycoplasma salivarium]GIZ06933.1 50S ribosomal protein L3 [Metamycoplasma salivarium]CAD7360864.1 50S ribosomal protein L3 [Metamycoplasma salivarium]VEU56060.1 50S ribosomal protein L3 [Metamycoplasma salivarium]
MKGILGRKVGMTQLFTSNGNLIPVTIVEVKPNVVTNVLTNEKNGYVATQLALEDKKRSQIKKPEINHFKKASTTPKRFVKEIRNMSGYKLGDTIDASLFSGGEIVDVTAISKGKGFAGTIKRYNQHIGPKSHGGGGGSQPIRQTGSIGDIMGNRVWPGMTMPGHMGHEQVTIQNLEIIKVDIEKNLILIKGSTPGAKGALVVIRKAKKTSVKKQEITLLNLKEALIKNELFEQAKKYNLDFNMKMTVAEMKSKIKEAQKAEEEAKNAANTSEGDK